MSYSLVESVKITREVIAEILQHARQCAPNECCGLLVGRGEIIERAYRLSNIAEDPRRRYFADPRELFQYQKRMRARREKLLGIYHSHPQSAAVPSPTDVEQAFYPEAVYVIVSPGPRPQVRAYRIVGGEAKEMAYEIVDDAPPRCAGPSTELAK